MSVLENIYYDPSNPASFGSVEALWRAARKKRANVTKKQVEQWLKGQETYTIHKQSYKIKQRVPTKVLTIDAQWQMDLADMQTLAEENDGYRFICVAICVFSKFAFAIPTKSKHGLEIVRAFQQILNNSRGRRPICLQTDKGTEFLNKRFMNFLAQEKIHFFTSHTVETKASVAERFIRTLKGRLFKAMTYNNTNRYLDLLPKVVKAYNGAYHRTIGCAPKDVIADTEDVIRERYYEQWQKIKKGATRVAVGDIVRILKERSHLNPRGFLPRWTIELFRVRKIRNTKPTTYLLEDWAGESIKGAFYNNEIQRVRADASTYFQVEKVIKKRKRGRRTEYLVKYLGWPEKFNEWVPQTHLKKV